MSLRLPFINIFILIMLIQQVLHYIKTTKTVWFVEFRAGVAEKVSQRKIQGSSQTSRGTQERSAEPPRIQRNCATCGRRGTSAQLVGDVKSMSNLSIYICVG